MKLTFLLSAILPESQRLIDAAQHSNIETKIVFAKDVSLEIVNNQLSPISDFSECDAMISRIDIGSITGVHDSQIREMVLHTFPELQKKMLNGESYAKFPVFSKLAQMLTLQKNGVAVPNTYYQEKYQNPKFPLVLKALHGSNGQQVHYITNQQEWDEVTKLYQQGEYFLQDPLPIGEDYRVIMLGQKSIGAYKKVSTTGFASNLAVGGRVETVEPERLSEIVNIALRAANALHCEYAGVDVMYDDQNKPRVLEVNRGGGFTLIEKFVPEMNVAQEILNYLVQTRNVA
jgi:RimK family alpha-L-glutamate ligase